MSVENNPDATLYEMTNYFRATWQERVDFWQQYLDGTLPTAEYVTADRSRQGRGIPPSDSARECLRVAVEMRDGWERRRDNVR